MVQQTVLYVVLDNGTPRRIQAVCATAEEAEQVRQDLLCTMRCAMAGDPRHGEFTIHAMNAAFPGSRFRLVYGKPLSRPAHPLEVPAFCKSLLTNTDAHSDAYLYPDQLFVERKRALAAAAQHNAKQLWEKIPTPHLDWAVVMEIGEPLWLRYRSECLVLNGVGWEETDLVRPVRVIHATAEEALCQQGETSTP